VRVSSLNVKDKKGNKVKFTQTDDYLGNTKLSLGGKADKINYTLEIPREKALPEKVSLEDYFKFVAEITARNEDYRVLTEDFFELPGAVVKFLDQIKSLSPELQVKLILYYAYEAFLYDDNAGLVSKIKRDNPTKLLEILQARLQIIKGKKSDLEGIEYKLFSGACGDIANFAIAMLRKNGFLAGGATGYLMNGKSIKVDDGHASPFVIWPDKSGRPSLFVLEAAFYTFTENEDKFVKKMLISKGEVGLELLGKDCSVEDIERMQNEILRKVFAGLTFARVDLAGAEVTSNDKANIEKEIEVREIKVNPVEALLADSLFDLKGLNLFFDIFWYGGVWARLRNGDLSLVDGLVDSFSGVFSGGSVCEGGELQKKVDLVERNMRKLEREGVKSEVAEKLILDLLGKVVG